VFLEADVVAGLPVERFDQHATGSPILPARSPKVGLSAV
jgi:hypothetical protein